MAEEFKINQLTIEQQKRIRGLLKESVPTTRKMSQYTPDFDTIGDFLGEPFDFQYVPINKLYDMRCDPMLAFGLHFIKMPLLRAQWYIDCPRADIASFIDYSLRKIYARYVSQHLTSLDFGFAGIAKRFELANPDWTYLDPEDPEQKEKKVWDNGNIPAVIWKTPVVLRPELIEPDWNSKGEFNGILFNSTEGTGQFPFVSTDSEDTLKIDLEHAIWVTNEKDQNFGSIWGYPRLAYSAPYWWSYWWRWALADRHFERVADPTVKVRFPIIDDAVDEDGTAIDLREIAHGLGQEVHANGTIALPSTPVTGGLDDKPIGMYEWDVEFLTTEGHFEAFDATFDRLEVLKLRSLFIPEQGLIEGKGGSSSRNVAAEFGDVLEKSQASMQEEIDFIINNYFIPQLKDRNFPEAKNIPCKKVTKGFGSEDMELSKALVQLIGQRNPEELSVDIKSILEQSGVPTLSAKQLAIREEKEIQRQLQMQPPQIGPANNQGQQSSLVQTPTNNYGTKEENKIDIGFSTNIWNLEEKNNFEDKLPETPAFEDKKILEQAVQIRDFAKEMYSSAYQDFLFKVSGNKIELADDDESLISKWDFDYSDAINNINSLSKNIMERAGNIELTKANKEANFIIKGAAEEWIKERGAFLVKTVGETVKSELRAFLSSRLKDNKSVKEIANDIRDNFQDFPSWKADRLARTEVTQAYNFGTLYAGKENGFSQVQALDARKGPTDADCENRNGKIFSIDEAFNIIDHPNGTLGWKLLTTTKLSVEEVQSESAILAYYDEDNETVYLDSSLNDELKGTYLIDLVNHL